jgi:hypothetical protein
MGLETDDCNEAFLLVKEDNEVDFSSSKVGETSFITGFRGDKNESKDKSEGVEIGKTSSESCSDDIFSSSTVVEKIEFAVTLWGSCIVKRKFGSVSFSE